MQRLLPVGLLVVALNMLVNANAHAGAPDIFRGIEPNGDVIEIVTYPNGFRTSNVIAKARLVPNPAGISTLQFPGAAPLPVAATGVRRIIPANGDVVDDWFLPINPFVPYTGFRIDRARLDVNFDNRLYWFYPGMAPVLKL
jgi:hypothetical protein